MKAPLFFNVDLEIESRSDLTALKTELDPKAVVLYFGPVSPGCSLLSLEASLDFDNPDDAIQALCSLLEGLSPKGKRAWRAADKKSFDVGYEAVLSQRASQFSLRPETIQRLSKWGATLAVSLYHHPENAANPSAKPARRKRRGK